MSEQQNLNNLSLLDLFLMETASQCLTLNQQMSFVNEGQDFSKIDQGEVYRALHSIKGAANIIDLQTIVKLTQAMEKALHKATNPMTFSPDLWLAINDGVKELTKITTLEAQQLRQDIEQNPNINNLLHTLCNKNNDTIQLNIAAPDSHPQKGDEHTTPSTITDISPDLFDIFKEDAINHLTVLSDNIIELEKSPHDSQLFEESLRAAHSLKGAARIIGFHRIVKLIHAIEDILVKLQQDKILLASALVDTLLAGCDLLKELAKTNTEYLAKWVEQNAPSLTHIQDLLTSVTDKKSQIPTSPTETTHITKTLLKAPRPGTAPDHDQRIRVSAKSINKLMGLAGEAIVESSWLPSLTNRTGRIKNKQNEIWSAISDIHQRLVDQGIPPYLEDSFDDLHHQIDYYQGLVNNLITEIDDHANHAVSISHRLQREVIANRMQPLAEGIKGLPRLVRDFAQQQHKNVHLEIEGAETLVDRDILEKLEAPLTHIITNAIDHGIESPEIRQEAGKPTEAVIKIQAKHADGLLHITISDDGGGVNYDNLRQTIIAKGLVSEKIALNLNESELLEFLFIPNFSTKSSLSESSGRGIGLDVVHNVIRKIRGNIEVFSEPGHGSYFALRLPLTLSIIRAIVAEINNEPYAFPLVNIDHIIRLKKGTIKEMEGRQYIISQDKRIYIIPAQQVLDLEGTETEQETLSIIALQNDNKPYGLIVDHIYNIRDLAVQPLNPGLGKLRSISAAAIAEDGTPILILDVQDLIITMDHLISGNRQQRIDINSSNKAPHSYKHILVVDDSITVREVEKSLLTNHGFRVDEAADGVKAWNLIKQEDYQLIITDVDMPNLDGIELLRQIRGANKFEDLPVIIVSYKDREEDKKRGLEAGADYYLTKSSFTDKSLIEAVEDLIGYPEKTP